RRSLKRPLTQRSPSPKNINSRLRTSTASAGSRAYMTPPDQDDERVYRPRTPSVPVQFFAGNSPAYDSAGLHLSPPDSPIESDTTHDYPDWQTASAATTDSLAEEPGCELSLPRQAALSRSSSSPIRAFLFHPQQSSLTERGQRFES